MDREAWLQNLMALPEHERGALCWLLRHYGFAEALCLSERLTEAQRREDLALAEAWGDPLAPLLLELERQLHAEK